MNKKQPKAKVMFTLHNKEFLVMKRLKPVPYDLCTEKQTVGLTVKDFLKQN